MGQAGWELDGVIWERAIIKEFEEMCPDGGSMNHGQMVLCTGILLFYMMGSYVNEYLYFIRGYYRTFIKCH